MEFDLRDTIPTSFDWAGWVPRAGEGVAVLVLEGGGEVLVVSVVSIHEGGAEGLVEAGGVGTGWCGTHRRGDWHG